MVRGFLCMFLFGAAHAVVAANTATTDQIAEPAQNYRLTFDERVQAQAAIERTYFGHQKGTRRTFDEAVPRALLERKVRTYLKRSVALEQYWNTPVTAEMLRRETESMIRRSMMPERLERLFAALGNDPILIQECLARPALVNRLTRSFFASDERIHGDARREAERLRDGVRSGAIDPHEEHPLRQVVELVAKEEGRPLVATEPSRIAGHPGAFTFTVLLEEREGETRFARFAQPRPTWDEWWRETASAWDERRAPAVAAREVDLRIHGRDGGGGEGDARGACPPDDTWEETIYHPEGRSNHAAFWTGSEMLVWGGGRQRGTRYDPVTDSWTPMSTDNEPQGYSLNVAVWTGTEMIVWGGQDGSAVETDTGGRYDPATDSWVAISTTGAPAARLRAKVVWTGSEMIVWGGTIDGTRTNTGGRYDAATDSWTATTLTNAPSPRERHTAVWTGDRMIVWGGRTNWALRTGSVYDPVTDSWTAMPDVGTSDARYGHSAVWTGSEMVIWGGAQPEALFTGLHYDPVTNSWTPSGVGPDPRSDHTAVWTGTEMLISGIDQNSPGARYDPVTRTWIDMTEVNAPYPRAFPSAVWADGLMIVWGGSEPGTVAQPTGARYDPATDSWTPTHFEGPRPRKDFTAVWTGNLLVIYGGEESGVGWSLPGYRYDPATGSWSPMSTWSGSDGNTAVWTGDEIIYWSGYGGLRYDPVANTWIGVSLTGAPSNRRNHVAVWTGSEMIVWGGAVNFVTFDTGGRYDPLTDSWTPTSLIDVPTGRSRATAVWSGTEMIVWGGWIEDSIFPPLLDTGGRYNPAADKWTVTSQTNAPEARTLHSMIWTGNEAVIWGGFGDDGRLNEGARYDPATDSWTPTSLVGAPSPRHSNAALWTGGEWIIWGGSANEGTVNTGARYNPTTDVWSATSTVEALSPRTGVGAVWTGNDQMLVWGGNYVVSGGTYTAETDADGDGYSVCRGDCDDQDPEVSPVALERCDGLDNNCNLVVDEDVVPPDVEGLIFADDDQTLSWTPGPFALGKIHDIARGAVAQLPVDGGADEICLASEQGDSTLDEAMPPAGEAWWYLVRHRDDCAVGSYGEQTDTTERSTGVCP